MVDDGLEARRAALAPQALPSARTEYVVRMDMEADGGLLTIMYVPDRFTIDQLTLSDYLAHVDVLSLPIELKAITIMEDLVNELVCRWVRVSFTIGAKTVVVEDRQPGWSNGELLSRLP